MKGKITTKQGDGGTTSIVGGERVAKDDPRIECLGELDEANSALGLLRSSSRPTINGKLGCNVFRRK